MRRTNRASMRPTLLPGRPSTKWHRPIKAVHSVVSEPPIHIHPATGGVCPECWFNAGKIDTLARSEIWLQEQVLEPNARAWIRQLIEYLRAEPAPVTVRSFGRSP